MQTQIINIFQWSDFVSAGSVSAGLVSAGSVELFPFSTVDSATKFGLGLGGALLHCQQMCFRLSTDVSKISYCIQQISDWNIQAVLILKVLYVIF